MKFNELVRLFGDRAWFDFEMVSLLSGEAAACVHTVLYRWRESGKVLELRRGLFTLAEPWRHGAIDGSALAQALYPPSYLSGAWALRRYGLLPVDAGSERPEFSSVTARPAKVFENPFGRYSYATFPRDLLFGARTELIGGRPVRVARPEKALLDYWFIEGGEWDEERIERAGLNAGGSGGGSLDRDRLEALAARAGPPPGAGRHRGIPEGSLMMREEILEAAELAETPEGKLCMMRECIQAATLRSLHELGAFEKLCLIGESALHFATGAPEYITDLEFSLVDKKGYKPEQWLFAVRRRLRFMGLDARIAFARKATIHAGWVKVTDLLTEEVGFRITIDIAPIEPSMCTVKLVDMAGESFGIRYIDRITGEAGFTGEGFR